MDSADGRDHPTDLHAGGEAVRRGDLWLPSRRSLIRGAGAAFIASSALAQDIGFTPPISAGFPYLGPVATGSIMSQAFNGTNKQQMIRRYCVAKQAIAALQIIVPNWYWNSSAETAPGSTASCTASVEYPAGTFTQITFSGSATGTIANGGQLLSDFCSVAIPNGAAFWVRIWRNCSGGITYNSVASTFAGEAMTYGVTVTDQTLGGTVSNTTGGLFWGPVAILGMTTLKSVYILGDSRAYGQHDTADATGSMGEIARSLVGAAYINGGIPGAEAQFVATSNANQVALSKYCRNIVCNLVINDFILSGRTSAQTITSLTAGVYPLFSGKPIWQTTTAPATTSTDNWATTANQTEHTSGQRAIFNPAVRSGLAGTTGYFDTTLAVEATLDGVWNANGVAFFGTPDGIHEQPVNYAAIASSGIINPAVFV